MSDLMLYGVLKMPHEMAMASELSRLQYWQRAQEAADRLEKAEARVEALEADAARYRWLRGAGNSMLGRFGGYTSTNADSVIDAAMKENQT